MVDRVVATPEALALIEELKAQYGALMFHQSGGCCDNSAANCDLALSGFDQTTPWLHLGYLVALAATLIAIAVLRRHRDRRTWMIFGAALASVAVFAIAQWIVYERFEPLFAR